MGWKASCLLASTRDDGYLGTFPAHDPARARDLARRLGFDTYRGVGPATFEDGVYPQNGELYVGAYDGAVIVGSDRVAEECLSENVPPFVGRLAACLPRAEMV